MRHLEPLPQSQQVLDSTLYAYIKALHVQASRTHLMQKALAFVMHGNWNCLVFAIA